MARAIHLEDKRGSAAAAGKPWRLRVRCGKEIMLDYVTDQLPRVSCQACREAFAAALRSLPDYKEE